VDGARGGGGGKESRELVKGRCGSGSASKGAGKRRSHPPLDDRGNAFTAKIKKGMGPNNLGTGGKGSQPRETQNHRKPTPAKIGKHPREKNSTRNSTGTRKKNYHAGSRRRKKKGG